VGFEDLVHSGFDLFRGQFRGFSEKNNRKDQKGKKEGKKGFVEAHERPFTLEVIFYYKERGDLGATLIY
jgi:hypothetical protein